MIMGKSNSTPYNESVFFSPFTIDPLQAMSFFHPSDSTGPNGPDPVEISNHWW